MALFDGIDLTAKEKAERGLILPDRLNICEIAELWSDEQREQDIYRQAMYRAFNNGLLKGEQYKDDPYWDDIPVLNPYQIYLDIEILAVDFLAWLESENEPRPTGCLLAKWWATHKSEDEKIIYIPAVPDSLVKIADVSAKIATTKGFQELIKFAQSPQIQANIKAAESIQKYLPKVRFAAPAPSTDTDTDTTPILYKQSSIRNKRTTKQMQCKAGKKLKPMKRATTESLELIYSYLESKGIKSGDTVEISAKVAWGEIIAQKFNTDLIKSITGDRDQAKITLNGGEEINNVEFVKKYNQRLMD